MMNRRSAIKTVAGAAAIVTTTGFSSERDRLHSFKAKGNLNHSVCKWCFRDMTVEELAANASKMGIKSVEIIGPDDWGVLQEYDMICAMANGPAGITRNINRVEHHAELVPAYIERIGMVADAGFPNLIIFSGDRHGFDEDGKKDRMNFITDEEGLENCVTALKQIVGEAEKRGITLCMELLNSKVNHPDYMCDRTEWGVELVDRVGSDNFKLLYDIYHMQIMEGDVIRTIKDYKDYFGHFHTAGNPGRNEIDDTQELNYKAIAQALVDIGYEGYLAQEFIPLRDPMTSLKQAIEICDV